MTALVTLLLVQISNEVRILIINQQLKKLQSQYK